MTRDLKIVSSAMLAWGFGEGMFYIFQPLYIQQFGADPILIGTILGINGLVMTVSQIPSGYLADRLGRRPLMRLGWICGVIAAWMMALAPTMGYYVAGLLLYGVTSSVMAPLNTYVQSARGNWSVGRAVSFVSALYNIGGILGPVIGGLIGEHFNLRVVYYAVGVVFTISTLIVLFADKQPIETPTDLEAEKHLLHNKRFLSRVALIFLVMAVITLPQPLAANFLQNQRGLSLSRIGQLGSLGALGSVLLMLVFGSLDSRTALIIGQAGVMFFSFLLWRGMNFIWYGIAYFFMGGYRLCRAMTVAFVRPVVRDVEVGLAFGIVESLNSLAYVVAPILAGLLYEWQPISIFPIGFALLVLSVGLSVVLFFRPGFDEGIRNERMGLEKVNGDEP